MPKADARKSARARSHESRHRHFWGRGLQRWPEEAMRDVALPASSKAFLTGVGLPVPKRMIWVWTLAWNEALGRLPGSSQIRLLGNNHSRPILLDEGRHGCAGARRVKALPVNASVEQSAISVRWTWLQREDARIGDASYDAGAQRRAVKDLRNRLREIDATAIDDSESLWSNILVEMRVQIYSSTI
ncbi:MAG: SUKH-4 family immunity protein [Caulobacteraceae bacterium]|nr:SUKH-4 family immunity protein [Caulobacteraceae bacterium]